MQIGGVEADFEELKVIVDVMAIVMVTVMVDVMVDGEAVQMQMVIRRAEGNS